MALENPFANPLTMTNFLLWVITTIVAFVIAIICFNMFYMKKEFDKVEKRNVLTWGFFFVLITVANFITMLWRFWVHEDLFLVIDILERIANVLIICSILIKTIHAERSINKLKYYRGYYFTPMLIVVVIVEILVPPVWIKMISPFQIFFLIIIMVGYTIFPLIYLYVAYKGVEGKLRWNAFKVSAGATLIGLGLLIRPQNLIGYLMFPIVEIFIPVFAISAPVTVIVGMILIFDSIRTL